ncbi:Cytochrome P450 [Corchorus capsularis]|uniref:Cytochrome P450 n=1 Tax=Corchorus capsularis TaxID=210143 RepID=A0A1R3ITV4_COCAP|nr:Cytochrome P450 [Corchorus capsularis]
MNRDEGDLGSAGDEDPERAQTSDQLDLNVEQNCHSPKVSHVNATQSSVPLQEETNADGVLGVGIVFESDEHAYKFYDKYARLLGFRVRKDWVNRSKVHGQVVSRKFTCSKQGYRRKDHRDVNVKKHRKATRTGCLAHMIITRLPDGKYRVSHFEANHNHDNINPNNEQTLQLQKDLISAHASETDQPNNSETQNPSFGLMNRRSLVRESLDCFALDYDNHLRSERVRDMKEGEAGRLLHYFQRQHFENPSFFYAIQLDIDDKVTNIFWADDNMILDYTFFGDVVCLDTSCRTNKEYMPFVQFLGVNHHNKVIIFAAALLYDDTVESLKWLFHTFLEAMSGKKPKVILTDQDATVVEAINSVLSETSHCVCVWQMHQKALKHLGHVLEDSSAFDNDFRSCIYDHEDEDSFIHAWEAMLVKYNLKQNEWLRWMYREREKWAVVYGRNTYFIDMKHSHLGESLSNELRVYLNSDQDVLQFFKHFERVVDEQRYKEFEASAEMSHCKPQLMANVILLKHASEIYTPKAFEVFQHEYEKSLNVVADQCSQNGYLYKVKTFGQNKEYNVTFDPSNDTVICSCMKFEYVGFLCSHALRVLDLRNIKVVPSRYILRRWTKDARIECAETDSDFVIKENSLLVAARRYKEMCRSMLNISARAAESDEAFQFASSQLTEVMKGVEKILTLKAEEAQVVTSSCSTANASNSENEEIFLDGNAIVGQDESRAQSKDENEVVVPHRRKLKNEQERGSKTKRIWNEKSNSPKTATRISSPPPAYVSPQSSGPAPVMQGSFNFEVNQAVQCIYQQANMVLDQQPSAEMYQQSNFYTDQHVSPSQTQLVQGMELDAQPPHSSSCLFYDHRYRTSDTPFLGPKSETLLGLDYKMALFSLSFPVSSITIMEFPIWTKSAVGKSDLESGINSKFNPIYAAVSVLISCQVKKMNLFLPCARVETEMWCSLPCISIFLAIALWIYKWRNPKCDGKLPPGSMGLPFVGESFHFFAPYTSSDVSPFIKTRMERYGSLFRTSLVGRKIVVSTDPDVNRFIFQQEGKLVQSWYMDSFDDIVGKDNVLSSHGFLHKYLRNLVLNLFGSENLKERLLSEIEELTSKHMQFWSCQNEVELKQAMSTMIYDYSVKKLFGCDESKFAEKLRDCYSAFLDGLISFPLNIPGTAYWKCLQGRNKAMKVLKSMLKERRKSPKRQQEDFLDMIVEEMNKAETILSEQTALDLLFALPFAAFESASSAIVLSLQYLQNNPLALAELTQEHEAILRDREMKDSGITWKEYKSMTFTHMVINETIRLGNIVPAIFRKVVKDVEIKGYTIPAGWIILACTPAVHLNPNKYEDPLTFNPWRWKGRELNAGSKFFMGFGSGARLCAGAEFVKLQMSIFLHHLVTKYRWKVIKEGVALRQPGLVFPEGFHIEILKKNAHENVAAWR